MTITDRFLEFEKRNLIQDNENEFTTPSQFIQKIKDEPQTKNYYISNLQMWLAYFNKEKKQEESISC
jgi:hypothetical protein